MNIFKEVKSLSFPQNSYIVVGSGILIALGLKEGHDVDIVVIEDIFKNCIENGWEAVPWTYPDHNEGVFLRKDLVELYLDVNSGDFKPTTKELLQRAQIINGVAFASVQDTLSFKREYLKNNPKHLADIKLLEKYISG